MAKESFDSLGLIVLDEEIDAKFKERLEKFNIKNQ
jgi:primosomal protein N'